MRLETITFNDSEGGPTEANATSRTRYQWRVFTDGEWSNWIHSDFKEPVHEQDLHYGATEAIREMCERYKQ